MWLRAPEREEELVEHLGFLGVGDGFVDLASACGGQGLYDPFGADAARGLDEHDVAGADVCDGDERGRLGIRGTRSGHPRTLCGVDGEIGEASAAHRQGGPCPDDGLAQGGVLPRRGGAELSHLAEDHDGTRAASLRDLAEGAERGAHALWVRVVRVVEDQGAVGQEAHLHAAGPGSVLEARSRERASDGVVSERTDDRLDRRQRAGQVDGRRFAEEREPGARFRPLAAAAVPMARACDPRFSSFDEAVVRVVAGADRQGLTRGGPRYLALRGGVIEAGDGDRRLRQRREQIALLARDVGPRTTDPLGVGDPDVRENGHIRLDDVRQRRDLAAEAHADLEDREAMVGLQAERDGRHADAVVEVARGGMGGAHSLEQRGAELLGGRLAGAAGDGEDVRDIATPPPGSHVGASEISPGHERVFDLDHVGRGRSDGRARAPFLDDDELRAARNGRLEVVVPVVAVAAQRDEGASRAAACGCRW